MVDIKIDGDQLQDIQYRLGLFRSKAPDILARAINSAAAKARKTIIKQVTEKYEVDPAALRKTIHAKRAKPSKPSGQVSVVGGRIPLSKFKTDPLVPMGNKPEYYSAALKKPDGMKPILGDDAHSKGFLVRMSGGSVQFVERIKGKKAKGTGKEALEALKGLSFPEMTGQRDVSKVIQEEAYRQLHTYIDKQIKKVMEGKA